MDAHQRRWVRRSGWWRVGLKVGAPLGLLCAGVGSALLGGGAVGVGTGLFLIVTAVMLWVSIVLVGLFSALSKRSETAPSGQNRAAIASFLRMRGVPKFVALEASGREKRRGYRCVGPGDYVASRRALYRIEHVAGTSLLVEDCRSGELIDIDREECARLRLVRPTRGGAASPPLRASGRGARGRRPSAADPHADTRPARRLADRELHTP